MAGIKLHGAVDVRIEDTRIQNAGRGIWLGWMAQGTRVTRYLLYDNTSDDLFVEVNHVPFLVDNNLVLSPFSLRGWSEGGAYAHNLFAGGIESRPELARRTPFLRPHSTQVAGVVETKGGDNRFYNNLSGGGRTWLSRAAMGWWGTDSDVRAAGATGFRREQFVLPRLAPHGWRERFGADNGRFGRRTGGGRRLRADPVRHAARPCLEGRCNETGGQRAVGRGARIGSEVRRHQWEIVEAGA